MFVVLTVALTREKIAINVNKISHAVRNSAAQATYIYDDGDSVPLWVVEETPSHIVKKIEECSTCNA